MEYAMKQSSKFFTTNLLRWGNITLKNKQTGDYVHYTYSQVAKPYCLLFKLTSTLEILHLQSVKGKGRISFSICPSGLVSSPSYAKLHMQINANLGNSTENVTTGWKEETNL